MNSLPLFRLILLLAFAMPLLCVTQSWAQGGVSIRSGHHDDYSRLVFDWPSKTSYDVKKSEGTLTFSFGGASSVDMSEAHTETLSNIGDVAIRSEAGQPLTLSILTASSFPRLRTCP